MGLGTASVGLCLQKGTEQAKGGMEQITEYPSPFVHLPPSSLLLVFLPEPPSAGLDLILSMF
jgi:hypothetical protein